jgi:hypothetical protein
VDTPEGIEKVVIQPDITRARVLRPYQDFETQYEGQVATVPVSFYEVSSDPDDTMVVRDDLAGVEGYDPNLERYVRVPFGSRVTVWIPYCALYDGKEAVVETNYLYTFHWRIRNQQAFLRELQQGKEARGYHMDRRNGYDDPFYVEQLRYALPGATNTVIVEQNEAAGNLQQTQHVRRERLIVRGAYADTAPLSILPDAARGVREQGVYNLANVPGTPRDLALSELYFAVNFDALGDELLIQATRADAFDDPPGGVWAFATTDAAFSHVYGASIGAVTQQAPNPGIGIYLFAGNAP